MSFTTPILDTTLTPERGEKACYDIQFAVPAEFDVETFRILVRQSFPQLGQSRFPVFTRVVAHPVNAHLQVSVEVRFDTARSLRQDMVENTIRGLLYSSNGTGEI